MNRQPYRNPGNGYGNDRGSCRSRNMPQYDAAPSAGSTDCRARQEISATAAGSCPCQQPDMTPVPDLPTGNRQQLLDYITQVSFAVYETLLYLDTHQEDAEALRFFHVHNRKRNSALREYERLYGPLTIETANETCSASWKWAQQPWPWEGGAC